MNRDEILQTANDTVNGPKSKTYGSAKEHFSRVATMWGEVLGTQVDADQVALCMMLVKIDRLKTTPGHADSWVDIAGYAALGGEVATEDDSHLDPMAVPAPVFATGAIQINVNTPTEPDETGVIDEVDTSLTKPAKAGKVKV